MTNSSAGISASAWSNGAPGSNGSGYGLKVTPQTRDAHFDQSWQSVTLSLPTGTQVEAPITPSFWNKCTEIRHADIGKWFVAQGLAPWPKGEPPGFDLRVLGPARFEVRAAQ